MLLQALPEFDPSIAQEFGYEAIQGATFLGAPLFDNIQLVSLLVRFAFNFIINLIIVGYFYYRKSSRRDYYLTFVTFNSAMFVLLYLMGNVDMQIGFTLSLFAIFGIIKYRTKTVPIREMTYLFLTTAIAVINGIAANISYTELVVSNLLIILVVAICEKLKIIHLEMRKVRYDNVELIAPDREEELIADLEKRLGLKIEKVEIKDVDFLKDAANIYIYYKLP